MAADPKLCNSHGHIVKPYYSTGIELPLLIGVVDELGVEHAYVSKQEWMDERNARVAEVAALKARIVRCRDCVHYTDNDRRRAIGGECRLSGIGGAVFVRSVGPGGYCAWGERRGEGQRGTA